MYHVRFGQWETNSSSVHQIVIDLSENKEEYPTIMLISNKCIEESECELIAENFENDFKFANAKLNFIFRVITSDDAPTRTAMLCLQNLLKMFAEHGIDISIDDKVFRESGWNYSDTATEIDSIITDILVDEKWDLLSDFVFNHKSGFLQEHNGIFYSDEENSHLYHEYDTTKFMIVTGPY